MCNIADTVNIVSSYESESSSLTEDLGSVGNCCGRVEEQQQTTGMNPATAGGPRRNVKSRRVSVQLIAAHPEDRRDEL